MTSLSTRNVQCVVKVGLVKELCIGQVKDTRVTFLGTMIVLYTTNEGEDLRIKKLSMGRVQE